MWNSPAFYVAVVSLITSATAFFRSHTAAVRSKAAVKVAAKLGKDT